MHKRTKIAARKIKIPTYNKLTLMNNFNSCKMQRQLKRTDHLLHLRLNLILFVIYKAPVSCMFSQIIQKKERHHLLLWKFLILLRLMHLLIMEVFGNINTASTKLIKLLKVPQHFIECPYTKTCEIINGFLHFYINNKLKFIKLFVIFAFIGILYLQNISYFIDWNAHFLS